LIYKTIIKSVVIYASIIWHASHDRSDSVVDTTTKFIKMQQQCLKMISDNFKAISTQILEVETHVKLIQLHLAHLQIKFRQQRMKKQHDVFISSFCNRIKNRLTIQRDKRRRRAVETSNERKQKWSAKLTKKIRKKNKMNEESIEKTWHRFFRVKWQQTRNAYQTKNRRRVCETLCLITGLLSNNQMWVDQSDLLDVSKWGVIIVQKYWFVGTKSNLCVRELPRLNKNSRTKLTTIVIAYNSSFHTLTKDISSKRLKLHRILTKSENAFVTHMRTKRIELADYLFSRRVSTVLSFDCFCDYSRQTLKHVLLFCMNRTTNRQRMFRVDETTNLRKLLNIEKKLKTSINWLMKINLLIQFSLIRECLK
jgi:hypothetical protein